METLSSLSGASDDELMQRILACEQVAFNELHLRYHPLLSKIVSQMLLTSADVEETVQDIFVEIWHRAANFDAGKGKALGWIVCMARRRAVDRLRRGRRVAAIKAVLQEAEADGVPLVISEASELDGQRDLARRDLRRALDRAIAVLPSEQQVVIRFVFYQELSQRQIAARTGIPLGTIKTRLELAMRKLSKLSVHLRADLF